MQAIATTSFSTSVYSEIKYSCLNYVPHLKIKVLLMSYW